MRSFERRRSIRIDINILVNYDKNCTVKATNVCEDGICIIAYNHYEKGSFLKLVFSLPGFNDVKVIGNVAWSRENTTGHHETGIEFWYIEEADKIKIREYIDKQERMGSKEIIYESSF